MADKRKTTKSNINWENIAVCVISLLIVAVIAIICICCTAWLNKSEDAPGNSGNVGDTIQEPPSEPNKPAEPHPIYVNYRLDGLAKDMSDYLECNLPAEVTAGETVTFTLKSNSASYKIIKVFYLHKSLGTGELLTEINGVYSFVMPDEFVSVIVYFETATE